MIIDVYMIFLLGYWKMFHGTCEFNGALIYILNLWWLKV